MCFYLYATVRVIQHSCCSCYSCCRKPSWELRARGGGGGCYTVPGRPKSPNTNRNRECAWGGRGALQHSATFGGGSCALWLLVLVSQRKGGRCNFETQ